MKDDTKYWIGFNHVKGIGPVRLEKLLKYFGNLQEAWTARPYHLAAAGLSDKLNRRLEGIRRELDLDALQEGLLAEGVQILTWDDPDYPERLRQIEQSPYVIYLKGNLIEDDVWSVAVVGTRRPSAYGRQVTEMLTRSLAEQGITIISGLARGIDGIAHQMALEVGGRTLAVLGSGLDHIYPPEHQGLADRISRQGGLISDYPPDTPPDGSNFPPRNRIIAALSKAVLVMEAGQRSGAAITANYAAEQGKEVFAVPGKITSPLSKGSNLLIKLGAHPLLEAQDVLDFLNMKLVARQQIVRRSLPGDPIEAVLYNTVGDEPIHVDEISNQAQLPIEEVISTLAVMELKGMVRKTFGMKYIAVREDRGFYQIEL